MLFQWPVVADNTTGLITGFYINYNGSNVREQVIMQLSKVTA